MMGNRMQLYIVYTESGTIKVERKKKASEINEKMYYPLLTYIVLVSSICIRTNCRENNIALLDDNLVVVVIWLGCSELVISKSQIRILYKKCNDILIGRFLVISISDNVNHVICARQMSTS